MIKLTKMVSIGLLGFAFSLPALASEGSEMSKDFREVQEKMENHKGHESNLCNCKCECPGHNHDNHVIGEDHPVNSNMLRDKR